MRTVRRIIPLGGSHVSFVIMISRIKRGRPVGTTRSAGYAVSTSGGRPRKTTENDGYLASKQGGRPPNAKSNHEASGKSTGEGKGCRVGKSTGRPTCTTTVNGYRVGLNGGVYAGSQCNVLFKDDVELPDIWDTNSETVNVDNCLLHRCASRIVQQRKFDSEPLAIGLCYSCGRHGFMESQSCPLLWPCHTS